MFILQPLHSTARLLTRAVIPLSAVRGVVDQDYWHDWLQYTDGYDWAILRVNPDTFTPPDHWTRTTAPLPDTFTAWQYGPSDPLASFENQEWFAAMYDEGTGILAVYRGHALYGMIPGYP